MPILEDLYNLLRAQVEPEAQHLATSLEIYVTSSLNVFNNRTNCDIKNRIVCFDVKELGKGLKKIAMLVLQDAVWNRVTVNRAAKRTTWFYIDEMHLLLKEEQTAAYTVEIWKRFRKEFLFQNDLWRKIAGINILVFSEKLKDNVKDDNSILAKIMQFVFSKHIRKAQRELPDAYALISEGYNKIAKDEEQNADIISISNNFADMIINACRVSFSLNSNNLSVLRGIFRWVYLIDALDDYDKDVKQKSFNPLLNSKSSFKDFVDANYKEIHIAIHSIMNEIRFNGESQKNTDIEDKIIETIVSSTIPTTTAKILTGQKNKAVIIW